MLASPVPALAKDEGSLDQVVSAVFGEKDTKIIRDYYEALNKKKQAQEHKAKEKGLPPGLAKREHLPPGLQRHLDRHGKLPPGLEKKRLPGDLNKRLSPVPQGYKRLVVGRDVVLVDERTQVIVDILPAYSPASLKSQPGARYAGAQKRMALTKLRIYPLMDWRKAYA